MLGRMPDGVLSPDAMERIEEMREERGDRWAFVLEQLEYVRWAINAGKLPAPDAVTALRGISRQVMRLQDTAELEPCSIVFESV